MNLIGIKDLARVGGAWWGLSGRFSGRNTRYGRWTGGKEGCPRQRVRRFGSGVPGAGWADLVNHDYFARDICNSGGFFGRSRRAATVEGQNGISSSTLLPYGGEVGDVTVILPFTTLKADALPAMLCRRATLLAVSVNASSAPGGFIRPASM